MARPKINSTISKVISLTLFTLFLSSCYYDNEEYLYPDNGSNCDTTGVQYSTDIAPLMASTCNACHSAVSPSGNIVTSDYNGIKTAIAGGLFWKAVNHEQGATPMPLNGNKLATCELARIKAWIDAGAPQN